MPIGARAAGTASGASQPPRLVGAQGGQVSDLGMSLAGGARALIPVDYGIAELESNGATGGIAEVRMEALQQGYAGLIERLSIQTDSSSTTSCAIYIGDSRPRHLRDYTDQGDLNVAEYPAPIYLPGGQALIIRWQGASAGAKGIAHVQYRIVQVADVAVGQLIGAAR